MDHYSSSSSRQLRRLREKPNSRTSSIFKRIVCAVTGKSCPICLTRDIENHRAAVITTCMHAYCLLCIRKWSRVKRTCPLCNAEFDSLFCRINLSSRTFHRENLWGSPEGKRFNLSEPSPRLRSNRLTEQRVIRRSREELRSLGSRTRPLPVLRSFGRPGDVHPDIIAERVRRWRASIYQQRLQAIPSPSKNILLQQIAGNGGAKEKILQRIEPWIRRELQAILGDPDPAVIVHVATSLFISMYDVKQEGHSEEMNVQEASLGPLRGFLHELTDIFWHELRCFAESLFSMETYDVLVEYKHLGS